MKHITFNCLISLFILSLSFSVSAQKPVFYDSPKYEFNQAMELFQKEKYGSAQQYFKYVYENTPEKQQDIKSNSYFYMGVCAANLYNNDAIFLLKDFIRQYPVHAFVPEANYYLGKFFFYKKQYKKALEHYELIDERQIKKEDMAEYRFKKGYSYFCTGELDKAKVLLNEARNSDGPYRLRAVYYLAHIAYEEKQYQAALEDFELLKNETEYRNIVPIYISQIYFLQGKYEALIKTVTPLLNNQSAKNQPEMSRIIGLSYYNLGQYEAALPYFDNYVALTKEEIDKNDLFAIGYTLYETENYQKALQYLSKTTKDKDTLAQNSFYIIGDCYLNLDQLALASQSFLEASKLDYNAEIKEDAMYNYAKLQFATSSSPFNSAIKALENYINEYPNSSRSEEANSYLSSIYMSTKNYQGAIKSLENIRSKSPELLKAYQRCTYFRAMELINNNNYNEALILLNKSLTYPMNKELRLSSQYWKAEADYRAGKYKEAYYDFQSYQQNENAKNDDNYTISFYSYGYSALKIGQYDEAVNAFQNFLKKANSIDNPEVEADATARLGDSYFMKKELNSAISYYEKCERMLQNNVDYSLYQQSKCYGYLKNDSKKIAKLEKLIQYYPRSPYIDDSEYELATTYHSQNNYTMAISAYKNFISKYPQSQLIRQAYNKLAQAYVNTQQEELAISTFKYVFETYPGSQEAKDAMANLETIYTEEGNTGEFFDYIKNKNMNISTGKQDSISYKAAENKYNRGDCEAAIKSFENYLQQFPNGLFASKAYFSKAECEYGMNNFDKALVDYEKLLSNYQTEYNETAFRKAATILYNKKEYQKAMTYFSKLIEVASTQNHIEYGNNGLMRCAFELKDYRNALNAAKNILNSEVKDPDLIGEAQLIAGKSAMELGEYVSAKKYLNELASASSNDISAEAAYLGCLIEFKEGNLETCEKMITDMLAGSYSSEYWLASTFILYGDLYAAQGNYFQARYTYQSIVDNYTGDDLVQIAKDKIALVNELENTVNKKNNSEEESEE